MKKVLIIVRNEALRVYLELKTNRMYEVMAVKSPDEALVWLEQNQVSLILTDYQNGLTEKDFLLRQIETVAFWSGASLLVVKDDDVVLPKKFRQVKSISRQIISSELIKNIQGLITTTHFRPVNAL